MSLLSYPNKWESGTKLTPSLPMPCKEKYLHLCIVLLKFLIQCGDLFSELVPTVWRFIYQPHPWRNLHKKGHSSKADQYTLQARWGRQKITTYCRLNQRPVVVFVMHKVPRNGLTQTSIDPQSFQLWTRARNKAGRRTHLVVINGWHEF